MNKVKTGVSDSYVLYNAYFVLPVHILIQRLCDFALKTTYGGLQLGCIDILVILAKSVAVNHFSLKEGQFKFTV